MGVLPVDLRILRISFFDAGDNPAERVHAPDRRSRPAKQYLYPSEFESLVGCKGVDLVFRTLYAVAVYTYARSNELAALTWDDVDLAHDVIHIADASRYHLRSAGPSGAHGAHSAPAGCPRFPCQSTRSPRLPS